MSKANGEPGYDTYSASLYNFTTGELEHRFDLGPSRNFRPGVMDHRYFALITNKGLTLYDKTTKNALYSCRLDETLGEARELQAHNGYIMTSQVKHEKSVAVIYNFFPSEKQ